MMFKQLFHHECIKDKRLARGYALLLAVVITATVLSAATALAGIVLSEIRQTRDITSAVQAYARAESSAEQALFMLRKSEISLADIQSKIEDVALDAPDDPQYFSVNENDFVSLAIPVGASPLDQAIIPKITRWEIRQESAEAPCPSWIEVTTITWDSEVSPPFMTNRHPYSREVDFSPVDGLEIPFGASGTPVEMRIRALYCDISELGVTGIPGRVRVISTAEQMGARQSIETYVSRSAPIAGLFDFVIFSEEEIIK